MPGVFTFLAKRGQQDEVARLLTDYIGKPKMSAYFGTRGVGVLLSLELPADWSKRKVNKLLAACGIAGCKKPKNRQIFTYKQLRKEEYCDKWVESGRIVPGKKFKWRDYNGRLYTAWVEFDICFDQPEGYFLFTDDRHHRHTQEEWQRNCERIFGKR